MQLLCAIPYAIANGTLQITTAAGTVFADFDVASIVQLPVIASTEPEVWSTTIPTPVIIRGLR